MAISNPITPQGIVDRFSDFVNDTANAGIVWGTNAKPFSEMPNNRFGGGTGGTGIGITGANIAAAGDVITALTIYNVLRDETSRVSNIRNMRARLNVTGGGGNTGSRPTAGIVFDQTAVAHHDTGDRVAAGNQPDGGVLSGEEIDDADLEAYFTNLQTRYNAIRGSTVTITIDVCHASCHSSCHGSRGRR